MLGEGFPYEVLQNNSDELTYWYGLSTNAENYEHGDLKGSVLYKTFFYSLFRTQFWYGLEWSIQFINRAIDNFKTRTGKELPIYTLLFTDCNITKDYYGFEKLWLATAQEHSVPLVISDLIYCLKCVVREFVKAESSDNFYLVEFAKTLKSEIINKSNNIALLTVISEIGMEFEKILPGYALDIASNIDLVLLDLTRKALSAKNPMRDRWEKQILLAVGIPFDLSKRYEKFLDQTDLIEYFVKTYISGDAKIKEQCGKILDYLYSIIPNDKDNALRYLQVNKMDVRNAQLARDEEGNIYIQPKVSGEAKAISENRVISYIDEGISLLINECGKRIEQDEITVEELVKIIHTLNEKIEQSNMPSIYEETLIVFILYAFKSRELSDKDRRDLCQIWINGINKLMGLGSFIFNVNATPILFDQINCSCDTETKNAIKKLILDCILYNGHNGVVLTIARFAHSFIYNNKSLARALFNTIVKLAEDKMKHEKYNAKYLKKYTKNRKNVQEFIPNRQPSLKWIDGCLAQDGKQQYNSNECQIIQEYLYEEKEVDYSDFDIRNYDIALMSYALNCRNSIFDEDLSDIVKKYLIDMVDMFKTTENSYNRYDYYDVDQTNEVQSLLGRDYLAGEGKAENLLNIMFDDMDFSKFNHHVVEFYLKVFAKMCMFYFDAYNNPHDREKCEKTIYALEKKICNISNEYVKRELYKSLILTLPRYAGMSDISKCPSGYSYKDKVFLNNMFSKYGGYHLDEMLATIYKFHLDKLLPDIIISLNDALNMHIELYCKSKQALRIENDWIILLIITKIFLDFSKEIKNENKLTSAYESVLTILSTLGFSEAAVILDEFRLH